MHKSQRHSTGRWRGESLLFDKITDQRYETCDQAQKNVIPPPVLSLPQVPIDFVFNTDVCENSLVVFLGIIDLMKTEAR